MKPSPRLKLWNSGSSGRNTDYWKGRHFGLWLFSKSLGLSGKLDLLLETGDACYPVDFKYTTGRPRHNHLVQLAGYSLLVGEKFSKPFKTRSSTAPSRTPKVNLKAELPAQGKTVNRLRRSRCRRASRNSGITPKISCIVRNVEPCS